jgi:hypothetical protein
MFSWMFVQRADGEVEACPKQVRLRHVLLRQIEQSHLKLKSRLPPLPPPPPPPPPPPAKYSRKGKKKVCWKSLTAEGAVLDDTWI